MKIQSGYSKTCGAVRIIRKGHDDIVMDDVEEIIPMFGSYFTIPQQPVRYRWKFMLYMWTSIIVGLLMIGIAMKLGG